MIKGSPQIMIRGLSLAAAVAGLATIVGIVLFASEGQGALWVPVACSLAGALVGLVIVRFVGSAASERRWFARTRAALKEREAGPISIGKALLHADESNKYDPIELARVGLTGKLLLLVICAAYLRRVSNAVTSLFADVLLEASSHMDPDELRTFARDVFRVLSSWQLVELNLRIWAADQGATDLLERMNGIPRQFERSVLDHFDHEGTRTEVTPEILEAVKSGCSDTISYINELAIRVARERDDALRGLVRLLSLIREERPKSLDSDAYSK